MAGQATPSVPQGGIFDTAFGGEYRFNVHGHPYSRSRSRSSQRPQRYLAPGLRTRRGP